MIPKVVHYTWFSGDPYPEEIQECMSSWRRCLPDYELRLWDMNAIADIDSDFLREALSARKWAYAADYVRLHALYNYGGIYLDIDAMLLRPLDEFMSHRVFIGKESYIHFTGDRSAQYLTSHCMGAEPKHLFIKDCLDYFADRHFILSRNERLPLQLRYNFVLLPYIQAEIARKYGYDWRPLTQTVQHCDEGLTIYPSEYFDSEQHKPHSTCRHLALGSWREDSRKQYNYTLMFKLRWRFLRMFQWVLGKFNYITMELE